MANKTKVNINDIIKGNDTAKAIAKAICAKHGGSFARVRIQSFPKLNAASKKAGYTLRKESDSTTRFGVRYNHISGVKLKEHDPNKANPYEWVVPNRIKRHKENGTYYAVIAPIGKGANTNTTYFLTDPHGNSRIITAEEAKRYTIPSYWNKDKPAVMDVALSNILFIK